MSSENKESMSLNAETMYTLKIKGHTVTLNHVEAITLLNLLSSRLAPEPAKLDLYKLWDPTHPPFQQPHTPYSPLWEVRPQDLPQYATNPYQTTGVESTPKTNGIEFTVVATTTETPTDT